ncbi:peptide/nickel transport system substrate-binding protein [Sulfitobacter undariae]|uniref:Peptide/nickel transport system substrate-binding protein n=1 Tax=Sulfitobacter undariae TaxID=1563671 RepID=A0A7W6E7R0_9RHOB|nr:ABC transporter substrate-binding protein [Sulfitobacter undariae]MBB3992789.1 peptide/nickel transport system substrate-binding protein [Sulfitobacter undariae]
MLNSRRLACATIVAASIASGVMAQDVVRIASPNKVTVLDPIASAAAGNIEAFGQLYARLLRRDTSGALQPALAESWTVSKDGLTYTFELHDAKFSDGTDITAQDVAFSLNRVAKDEASSYPAAFVPVKAFTAIDDDTVELTLEYPSAPMLSYMEIFNAGIVSMDDVQARGDEAFLTTPVSSGPFMVEVWKPNDRLILKANPYYWREGYPKVAGAELIEISDDNTRGSMIMAGEIDANRGVPFAQVDEMNANDGVTVPLEPSTLIYEIMPNHAVAPFDNINVRKAAAMALHREAMVKAMTLGKAVVANSTLPNALTYYAADVAAPSYDPAAARALLEAEGALGAEVTLMVTPQFEQAATLLKAQWDAAGFKTSVERVDPGLWWDRLTKGEYQVTVNWWYNETEDPDLAVRWAVCGTCGNKSYYTNYNNEEVNAMVEAALREQDDTKRSAIYGEIQRISTEELAQIPLYYPPFANAYSTRIKGLTLTPSLQWTLEEAEFVE